MNGWTWREESPTRMVMEKPDAGAVYVFEYDGTNWTGTYVRAAGHEPITEPVAYEDMMLLKAIAEKPG